MEQLLRYDRLAAVAYAHHWAYGRNPRYYDYERIGGDCTSFASQCLYAGAGVMNFTPDLGWYYLDGNRKAPAWTGVPYFYRFLTRNLPTRGPVGVPVPLELLRPGDFVQLRFDAPAFGHTPVVVEIGSPSNLDHILVAAHSQDTDFRPLSTYSFQEIRGIHILGVRR